MKDRGSIEGEYPGYIEWEEGRYPSVLMALSHVDRAITYFQPNNTIFQDLSGLDIEAQEVFYDGAYLVHIEALDLGFNLTTYIGDSPVRHTGSALVNNQGLWICLENDVDIRDNIIIVNRQPFKVKRVQGPLISLNCKSFYISTREGFRTWLLICPLSSIDTITGKEVLIEAEAGASSFQIDRSTNPALVFNQKILQAARRIMSE